MHFANNTFLVTGGASGLGAATARRVVEKGGFAVICDVNAAAADNLAAELGHRAVAVETDVTDEASVRRALEIAAQLPGPLRGAINCAGILGAARVVGRDGPHDLALFGRVINVNLVGTFNVLRLAADAMSKLEPEPDGQRGALVTTSSIAAFEGQIGQTAYSASKAGVAGMTLPIARELARFGIRVMSIAPGAFDTPMMSALPGANRQALIDPIPFPHRLGEPEEFAALVEHIVENAYLNGEVIRLDAGLRMPPK